MSRSRRFFRQEPSPPSGRGRERLKELGDVVMSYTRTSKGGNEKNGAGLEPAVKTKTSPSCSGVVRAQSIVPIRVAGQGEFDELW